MIQPSGPCPARIMLVGEMPGDQEILKMRPFEGTAGEELNRMLADAGIIRSLCFVSLVLREKLPSLETALPKQKKDLNDCHVLHNGRYVHEAVLRGMQVLKREIELCQPNIIIALGELAMFMLTGQSDVSKWRGSQLMTTCELAVDPVKVIPTYSPSTVFTVWQRRPIVLQDFRRAVRESLTKEYKIPEYSFVLRPDYNQVRSVLTSLILQAKGKPEKSMQLSVDIETRFGQIACIGLAWSKTAAICIPILCVEGNGLYWGVEQQIEIYWMLKELFALTSVEHIGQNFLYDCQYFMRHLLSSPKATFDTMIAQHVCFSGMEKSLGYLSSIYCEYHLYWKDDGKEWKADMDEEKLWRYNCMDCVRTFEVAEVLKKVVKAYGLTSVNDFQQKLFHPVLAMMVKGVRLDAEAKAGFAVELSNELSARQRWINEVVDAPLNIKSSPQMIDLFYRVLQQAPNYQRKGREKTLTCNDEALGKIKEREPLLAPLVNKISEVRSIGVFLSTFVNSQADIDSRMRCSYNIAGTDTYRFSSSKNAFGSGLNLQNIPKGGEDSGGLVLPNVRKLFIPDEGMEFFDIDLSSADLRIVVWESDEGEMKAMLREGYDPYTVVAQEFYHDQTITKKDPRRQTFKGFCHGTHYLGTAKGLAERFGLSVREAEKTQAWYFGRFPNIKKWQDDLKDRVFRRKYITNIFGYRYNILDRIDQSTLNAAAAWIPQSTVGCLINRGLVRIAEEMPEVQILLQVHDSLAGQYPIALAEQCRAGIVQRAEVVLPYSDPLVIPVGIVTSQTSWGACG